MDMHGEQRIPAPQQKVWEALNDPEILKDCIPGCESLEKVSDTEHRVALTAAVGPVKAKFKGKMLLTDLNPPDSYRLRFEGQGGVAGFAKGEADVALKPDTDATLMNYQVKAQVGGKLAQVGSRLIDAAAKKVAHDFFSAFNERVAPAAEAAGERAPAGAAAPSGGVPVWAWWAGGAVAAAIVIFLLVH
jgi:carbon monoxide dehydrogenase subunit G